MMFDSPNWFWNTFAITVFIAINIILWFHLRRCKAKGAKPKPAFQGLQKHEKQIAKWSDIFIISIVLLGAFFYFSILFVINNNMPTDIPDEHSNARLSLSVNSLFLFIYFSIAVTLTSLLSPFHKNITIKKRLTLIAMCSVPLIFGVLYCAFDSNQNVYLRIKLLTSVLLPVLLINGPPILLGRTFFEFSQRLFRKIPLPWFRIPTDSISDNNI